jgi:hypothetical protein
MFRYWRHLFLLSLESHCVILLRANKLTGGGTLALDEALRIVVEKSLATAELHQHVLRARSPLFLAITYRRLVRNNMRRLTTSVPADRPR